MRLATSPRSLRSTLRQYLPFAGLHFKEISSWLATAFLYDFSNRTKTSIDLLARYGAQVSPHPFMFEGPSAFHQMQHVVVS
ncbi:hypothetical protein CGZ80_02180 [Rhodopirellula sp. MGV]|nr:hypothetical protein CGZ80_02180 [Rhodopirellula sp. MGV]